mmetsp:Transcript_118212/g.339135  ORF Transcript_118212/g.339135 Transcript_118212/m.339135 type:complete len:136 (+) Transcript_118212:121-528(+)
MARRKRLLLRAMLLPLIAALAVKRQAASGTGPLPEQQQAELRARIGEALLLVSDSVTAWQLNLLELGEWFERDAFETDDLVSKARSCVRWCTMRYDPESCIARCRDRFRNDMEAVRASHEYHWQRRFFHPGGIPR